MNEYQEAYERLTRRDYKYADTESVYEDLESLRPLVERATQKEPISKAVKGFDEEVSSHLVCPNCGQPIVHVWRTEDYKPNYCHYCGQALKWSEKELV